MKKNAKKKNASKVYKKNKVLAVSEGRAILALLGSGFLIPGFVCLFYGDSKGTFTLGVLFFLISMFLIAFSFCSSDKRIISTLDKIIYADELMFLLVPIAGLLVYAFSKNRTK